MLNQSYQKIPLTKDLCKKMLKGRTRNNLLLVLPPLVIFLYMLISGIQAGNYLFCAFSGFFFLCSFYSFFKSYKPAADRIYLVRDEVIDIEKCIVHTRRSSYTEHQFFFRRFGRHCIRDYGRPLMDLSQRKGGFSLQELEQNSLDHFHREEEFYLLICERKGSRKITRIFSTQSFEIDLADFALQDDLYIVKGSSSDG